MIMTMTGKTRYKVGPLIGSLKRQHKASNSLVFSDIKKGKTLGFLQPNNLLIKPLAYCSGTAGSLGHYHKSQLLPRFCLLRNLKEPAIIVQLDNRD